MGVSFSVHTDGMEAIKDTLAKGCSKAEHALATQVLKDTEPFVPADTKSLSNRAHIEGYTAFDYGPGSGNVIVYPGPYARYLYYGKVMVNSATGKGPMHFVDKDGNEQIKFPKGSTLRPTDRNLKISKEVHKQACSHWFEASKAQNLQKWLRIADEAVKHEF